jgi:hypothetical protein
MHLAISLGGLVSTVSSRLLLIESRCVLKTGHEDGERTAKLGSRRVAEDAPSRQ